MAITRAVTRALVLSSLAVADPRRPCQRPRGWSEGPEFALNGPDGKPVKLSDLTAKGPVVVYTFIAAFTPT